MPRGGGVTTAPKYIWLTDAGRQAIQAWADRQGVSFSAAIETLARLGLQQAPEEALAPALVSVVRREIAQQLHRLASLTAASALDAGIAARMASAALKQQRPDEYEAIKQAARLDAVAALRRRKVLEALGVEAVRDAGDARHGLAVDDQAEEDDPAAGHTGEPVGGDPHGREPVAPPARPTRRRQTAA
jgi:hypothetical protein